jgi:hypothetical protein
MPGPAWNSEALFINKLFFKTRISFLFCSDETRSPSVHVPSQGKKVVANYNIWVTLKTYCQVQV